MPKKEANDPPKFSETIAAFCDFLASAQKDYTWNYDMVNKDDLLTNDLLHSLELDKLDYKQRAKISTRLAKCRKERRNHKDTVRALEPLVEWLDTDKGKQLFNLLREVLGKTRKVEERMENRVYVRRIIDEGGKDG